MKPTIFNNKGVLSDSRVKAVVPQKKQVPFAEKHPGVFGPTKRERGEHETTIDEFVDYDLVTDDPFLAGSWKNAKLPELSTESDDLAWKEVGGDRLKGIYEEMVDDGIDFTILIPKADENGVTHWPTGDLANAEAEWDWFHQHVSLEKWMDENVGDFRRNDLHMELPDGRKRPFKLELPSHIITVLDVAKAIVLSCGYWNNDTRGGEDMFSYIFSAKYYALLSNYRGNAAGHGALITTEKFCDLLVRD